MVCTQDDYTTLRADRDKEIALVDADLQKQLTGNESAHTTAVNNANSAHSTATANAEAARKSAEQAALSQLNSTLAQATKDKEASIAGAERLYDQVVASLDAQYGSESSNGDTGVEGATRRSAIKTRDAQYYAARDTSWANTLSGSTTLGTSPWSVKAISAAKAQAAYSTARASAQAAHDAAMLDAIEDWQLSSRESLTDLLFTEGQSRETYNVAASNVYANWENGVGNLLGDKPEGTGWEEGMNLGGYEKHQPRGPNNTPGNGFAAFVVWTPHEPEPPKKPQPIPPPPQQPHPDDNIFSSPERPSIEKLQFLYDHFGKDRAEELIEMRWPSKPYPESKYSMSAYEPSNEERLAQGFPGYDRLRYLIDRYEAGDTDGRERDEMRQLATDFQFYWRVKNGSGGTLMGTAMMVTGLTVAGQNPKFNSFAGSASAVIAARPTPVRPNLRLEIRPRYTQQPVPSAPKTFTTKEPSGSPAPKFKMQPVAPPAPLDKLQTVAPNKTVVQKIRYIGGRDVPDAEELSGVGTISGKLHRNGSPLSGEFDFVVGLDGVLRIGKGHEFLANASGNKDFVQAAGRIYVKDGKITMVTNESGHYKPSMQQADIFPYLFKETLGIDLSGAYLKTVEEVFLPFSGMLEPSYIKEHNRVIR